MESQDLFDEVQAAKPKKGIHYGIFTTSSLLFIFFTFVDIGFDLKTGSVKTRDWDLAFVVLFLPAVGVLFHFAGKKIGWIINTFYYLLMTIFIGGLICFDVIQFNISQPFEDQWLSWLFLLSALLCCIFLLMRPLRSYFRIGKNVCAVVVIAAIAVGSLLAYALIQRQIREEQYLRQLEEINH